jgi:hypothetical protein
LGGGRDTQAAGPFFISSISSFLFCQITPYVPASGARPTQHHTFIANGIFAVQRAACGSAACPKGWPNNRKEK